MSKSELSRIEATIQNYLTDFFGDRETLHLIVGVSGGVDSMCLLYALHRLNISACAVHLNYQKRGEASRNDARLVERMARQWNFECRIIDVNPKDAEGQNFQEWARDRRYRLFDVMAEQQQADGIAVAHHRDDQIETILLKMFRGGGLASWSAMQVWDGRLFRPLLEFSREEITAYARREQIPYRTDVSNLESDFARNFLRNEWLESLSDFFPGWKKNILRISKQARQYDRALAWIADHISDGRGIEREAFHTLGEGLQKAVLLSLVKERNPDAYISRQSLAQVEALSGLQTGGKIQLTKNFSLIRDRNYYCILEEQPATMGEIELHKDKLEQDSFGGAGLTLALTSCDDLTDPDILCLDPDKMEWPLRLRRWKDGDRFQPLGMEGHQLVSDHLTNRKVPSAHKRKALVIESFEETICAVIFPPVKNGTSIGMISEQVKLDAGEARCLKIRYST
ncbi:tRNA lysidine(34) synthetase TilS [Fodinibius sediminis]|uniref:tRNA(Ile)-lysidine synthase n=1 Tax=Fodinibius sediminis TaxID=1214077 RepID=A0A521D5H7_9BACT|nr:tRNA lysidine(34) synthetase TilS [Fodinibius sediminis]SMO66948.1 tRNA(Ile)-lysidine synthase [Fodinibius sediminis]